MSQNGELLLSNVLSQLRSIDDALVGRLGISAIPIGSHAPHSISWQDQEYYPTASTMKVPLLVTLMSRVVNGDIDLDARIEVKQEHMRPGGGVLRTFQPGFVLTVRDLATIMIIVSDNTATDLIFGLVGMGSVNAMMRSLGLNQINVVLDARDILYDVVGLERKEVDRLGSARAIEEFFRRRRLSIYNPDTIACVSDTRNDVAYPIDMARLMTMIHSESILTPTACREIERIMKLQQHRQMAPRLLPKETETATKSGGVETVRADVGLIYLDGLTYAFCGMAKEVQGEAEAESAIAHASRAVYDHYFGGTSR